MAGQGTKAKEGFNPGDDKECPICFLEFHHGAAVVIMGCGGNGQCHFICLECYNELEANQGAKQSKNLYDPIIHTEGGIECPMCRCMSYCATEAVIVKPQSGRSNRDPICID